MEFAYFYHAFGTKVTLVEMLPQIVPVEDEEIAKALHRSFEKPGMTVHVNTKVENVRVGKDKVELTLVKAGEANATEVEAETLLVAIGGAVGKRNGNGRRLRLAIGCHRGIAGIDRDAGSVMGAARPEAIELHGVNSEGAGTLRGV